MLICTDILYVHVPYCTLTISITNRKLCWLTQGKTCPFRCALHQINTLVSQLTWSREC